LKPVCTQVLEDVSPSPAQPRAEEDNRRKLEQRLIETSAREQIRSAEELHDGLREYFSALAFHTRMLADDLREDQSQRVLQAERIATVIHKINLIMRQLSRAFRVPELEPGGLAGAIRIHVAEFEQRTGIRCEFVSQSDLPAVDEFNTIMLFRIIQEAFAHGANQAQPHTIRTVLAMVNDSLKLTVHCESGKPPPHESTRGDNLSILMKLRAELIGAVFEAGATPTGSYQIDCSVPASLLRRKTSSV
jgi:signal transduction histidine kinase